LRLVLFDIDGTLTVSDGFGRRCFLEALASEFGITDANSDWGAYEHVTDAGISRQILREHRRREPVREEIERLRDVYLRRFADALIREPGAYQAVPGARGALTALGGSSQWRVGIASGNWRTAGRMKLRSAGLVDEGLVCGYAEDAVEKPRILAAAIAAAREDAGIEFESVVYVGDAPWDVRAAAEIGVGFVGVSHGLTGTVGLRSTQAHQVVCDYEDIEGFEALLRRAQPLSPQFV